MSEASPLSAPQSPLVGRGGDLLAIAKWLDEGARIVTVTGPVGIGKSRVALEVARRAAAGGASVAIAACGAAAEAETLCDAVASALAMEEEEGAGDPVLRIARALSARGDFVLVLDELDSIGPRATPILARWLALAPELAILVAARGRTHVAGEIVHELGPLPEAEALFFACAQRVRAGFSPSDADREHARAIVEALDGVPLAIELAAARMSVMGTRALLHRIGSGAERGLARAIDAAWSALDPIEQRALAELTVLRAPFTVDAAEAIVDVERPAVDVISALRDKSLLLAREDERGDVRLWMYGAMKERAAAALDPPARARAEERHAAYFVGLAERGTSPAARAQIAREKDELLAVIERVARQGSVSARAAEPALRALLALAPALFARGPLRAYELLVDPAIAATRGSGADPRLVGHVLLVRGALHRHRGAASKGARDLVQALGVARTIGDVALEARALGELGHAFADAGQRAEAEEHLRRAAELHARAGDRIEEGRALADLAPLALARGAADDARALLDRALALHADDGAARASDLLQKGAIELASGQLAAARAATDDALRAAEVAGDRRVAARARMQLGLVARRAGDRALARASLEAAAAAFGDLGFATLEATAQGHLGALAREEGRVAEAHALLSAACAALSDLAGGPAASAFAAELAALDAGPASALPPPDALVVGAAGAWFRPPGGARVGLERRAPLARIAERLAKERLERPDAALPSRALQDAAWPGEKIVPSAGAHRVRVAVSTLRKLGLPIVTRDQGYALDPAVPIARA